MAITRARAKRPRRSALLPQRLTLHAAIDDIHPAICRTLSISERTSLPQLHRVLQVVFGWYDMHLHMFTVGEVRYAEASEEDDFGLRTRDSATVSLSELSLEVGSTFAYEYDFGDSWCITLTVEDIAPEIDPKFPPIPLVLEGERAGPPEDCGGAPGYERLLAALRAPETAEGKEMLEWLDVPFDPERYDLRTARHALTMSYAWGAI